jgi:hypothetical protein
VTLPKRSLAEDVSAATVAVLAPQLPGADPERLAAQIEALKLLPAHARGLLAHLQAHPDALTSGEATGPSALRALLDVLATEHPAVQRVRCHRCGAQRRLPYRRGGASICGRCYAQTHLKVCVRCGELGRPDSREDGGIVCLRCKVQDPARRDACTGCGKTMRVAYRVGGKPFCQTCGPPKLYTCSSCGRQDRRASAFTSQGPICSICYRRSRQHECLHCGRTTVQARVADRVAGKWICNRCWIPPTMTCSRCGQVRPCARSSTSGRPVCSTCSARDRRPRPCALCERTVAIQTTLPLGPVCGPCYRQLRRSPATCASCKETRPLVGVDDAGREVCGPCSGDERNWICKGCGQVDLLIGGTHCLACAVKARVHQLLAGPDGQIPTQLEGLATFLLADTTPEQAQEVLNGSQWIQLVGALTASGEPITHQVLDDLGHGMQVRHLRHVLVHTGALDEQGEGLESVQPWMKSFLAGVSRQTAAVLRPYAVWSVLPRARHRAARGRMTTSAPKYARVRIAAAEQFLTWLENNDIALADATQRDVDTWLGLGATTRHRLRDFLSWAHARGLTADLEVHWLGRNGLAEQLLGDDERWVLLRRCLRDDALSLRVRVAGALVLLYGQVPSRIVELTVDHITTTDTDTYLALREKPVLLPPPLATLTTQLTAQNRQRERASSRSGTPTWLFPGARAGSHLDRGHLSKLLNKKIGVFIRPARGAALSALAADLPAPVLAELLGLSISTATRWAAHAARDEADYVAARITNPPTRPVGLEPVRG